jgi:hypothetical protein
MKKLLMALMAFTIGVAGFNLLDTKQQSCDMKILTAEQTAVKTPKFQTEIISYENVPTKKPADLKPFFDSFGKNGDDENDEYQNYGGWFIADDFKGMPEVWTLLLDRDTWNSKDGEPAWRAMILTQNADYSPNDDDNFQSVSMTTEDNRLSFRTNKIRGIEYKFDGQFTRNGTDFSQDEKVLRGTLRKIVKGKQVAAFTADFGYHEPHCFH